jgi:SsrA-binding protein
MKVITTNRRARHDFDILERIEAGLVLEGSEVKSLREGKADLKDSYAMARGSELWLIGAYIAPYSFSRGGGHEPDRSRKLLLHRREIDRLASQVAERGLALVPLQLYFKDGVAKLEIGLGKGRRTIDKRELIKKRDQEREIDRHLGRRAKR